jgi:hypothetical protein
MVFALRSSHAVRLFEQKCGSHVEVDEKVIKVAQTSRRRRRNFPRLEACERLLTRLFMVNGSSSSPT